MSDPMRQIPDESRLPPGIAAMSPEQRLEAARKGGRIGGVASQASGNAHVITDLERKVGGARGWAAGGMRRKGSKRRPVTP
jgi:hypothetical protein